MRKIMATWIVSVMLTTLAAGCVAGVRTRPPSAKFEVRSEAPNHAAVWIDGYWQQRHGDWIWIGGHWAKRPATGAEWVPGHWTETRKGWVWSPGHWGR